MKNIFSILLFLLTINAFSLELQSKEVSTNHTDIHYYQTTPDKAKQDLIMLTGIGTTANFWPRSQRLHQVEERLPRLLSHDLYESSSPPTSSARCRLASTPAVPTSAPTRCT